MCTFRTVKSLNMLDIRTVKSLNMLDIMYNHNYVMYANNFAKIVYHDGMFITNIGQVLD